MLLSSLLTKSFFFAFCALARVVIAMRSELIDKSCFVEATGQNKSDSREEE